MNKRKALVTGASSGVGKAIAQRLSDEGYELYVVSRTKPLGLPPHTWLEWDLSDTNQLVRDLKRNELKDIDVFVGNAGVLFGHSPDNYPLEAMNSMVNIHVVAQTLICNYVLTNMAERNFGRVVLIGSSAAATGHPDVLYAATKAATASLAQSYAELYVPLDVTVNCIQPGAMRTNITKNMSQTNRDYLAAHTIIAGEYLDLNRLADMTLNLLSDENTVTGAVIDVHFNAVWKHSL